VKLAGGSCGYVGAGLRELRMRLGCPWQAPAPIQRRVCEKIWKCMVKERGVPSWCR
jgi:hypothetical protein